MDNGSLGLLEILSEFRIAKRSIKDGSARAIYEVGPNSRALIILSVCAGWTPKEVHDAYGFKMLLVTYQGDPWKSNES